jgi:hypothetical protein
MKIHLETYQISLKYISGCNDTDVVVLKKDVKPLMAYMCLSKKPFSNRQANEVNRITIV